MIYSKATTVGTLELPAFEGHVSMVPFELSTLFGLPEEWKAAVEKMVSHLKNRSGVAFFPWTENREAVPSWEEKVLHLAKVLEIQGSEENILSLAKTVLSGSLK